MTRKKILLLSVSAGTGHTRAAEALRSFATADDVEAEAVHLDILQFATPLLRALYTDFYLFLIRRAPALWSCLYRATDHAQAQGLAHKLRRWAERLNCRRLLGEITRRKPDLIICTHFLPAEMLSHFIATDMLDCPVWVQVTDFDLHRMWVHEHMAGYFAPNEEVAFRMRAQGIAAERIHVTGIPIMPVFSQRDPCPRELHNTPRTLLLMGGGPGFGSVAEVAERLLRLDGDFQIIAMAGKDAATLEALQELASRHPGRLMPQGYTGKIERLMARADLVITKPGGLTTAESLAMGLPMIVIAPIPGQEEGNANFLLEQGAALQAIDLVTLEYRVRYLLADPAKLRDMRIRAQALGRPDAARRVLKIVMEKAEA